ncbi:unnamed protein product [Parajaminaea phylloscopi]
MSARRSTLASIDPPNAALPPPSSGIKSTKYMGGGSSAMQQPYPHRTARQSIAPPRQSVMAEQDVYSTTRHANGRSHGAVHRMSTSTAGGVAAAATAAAASGRYSMAAQATTPNSHRRSVTARQSLAPGAFNLPTSAALGGVAKPMQNADPRPLRSREYIAEMKARVHDFAEQTGFGHAGYRGYASLDSPTQAIFLGLFRHIFVNAIDSNYAFSLDARKPEEEIMTILQEYKYPAMGDVTKMLLGSASSQQYWPKTLGILDWMVGLSQSAQLVPPGPLAREDKQREHVAALTRAHAAAVSALHSAPRLTAPAEIESLQARVEEASAELREAEHGSEASDSDRAFFPFMWNCYESFWQGDDQFPDEVAKLEQLFEAKNASVKKEVERLTAERRKLEDYLKEMESVESPLARAQSDSDTLRGDLKKFTKYRDDILLPKVSKTKLTIARLMESREESQLELAKLTAQHENLTTQVSSQEMSAEEFDQLCADRAALTAEKDRLEVEIKEHENRRYELELANSNLQQHLEEKLKTFNPLGSRVGLFPLQVAAASGRGEEYLDEIDLLLGQSTLLHPGVDFKSDLRPKIQSLRREVEVEQRKAIEEKVERQERYDEICERLHGLKEQSEEVSGRLEVLKESIDEIQRLTDEETRAFNDDQLIKERKLHAIEQSGYKQLQNAEAKLLELKAHQKHLAQMAHESLEGYKDELCAAVEECVGLKNRVGESLEVLAARVGVEPAEDPMADPNDSPVGGETQ